MNKKLVVSLLLSVIVAPVVAPVWAGSNYYGSVGNSCNAEDGGYCDMSTQHVKRVVKRQKVDVHIYGAKNACTAEAGGSCLMGGESRRGSQCVEYANGTVQCF